jgi:hypothetical protein
MLFINMVHQNPKSAVSVSWYTFYPDMSLHLFFTTYIISPLSKQSWMKAFIGLIEVSKFNIR